MFHLNEIAAFLIMAGGLAFAVANRSRLRLLPGWPLLFSAFLLFLAAGVGSILENVRWYEAAETLEVASYAAGNVLAAVWCGKVVRNRTRRG